MTDEKFLKLRTPARVQLKKNLVQLYRNNNSGEFPAHDYERLLFRISGTSISLTKIAKTGGMVYGLSDEETWNIYPYYVENRVKTIRDLG